MIASGPAIFRCGRGVRKGTDPIDEPVSDGARFWRLISAEMTAGAVKTMEMMERADKMTGGESEASARFCEFV